MRVGGSMAVVTGAAGGLGSAIARALHDRGAQLILTGRRKDALDSLASQVGQARVVVCDLADRTEADRLADQIGDADIMVANAALPATGKLVDFTPKDIDRALEVNLRVPIVMTRQLLPGMLERGRGHLVYISSIAGKLPTARLSVYAATKFGLRGFSSGLRQDLAGTGVSSSVVFPGSITDAGMLADNGLPAAPHTKGLSAADVGRAVVEAIEQDKAEIDVADRMVRIAARLGGVAPGLMAKATQRPDSIQYADRLAEGLGHLR
jgi:short-subunit dehydrogenase